MEALADMDKKGELSQPKLSGHQEMWKKFKRLWDKLKSRRMGVPPPGFQRADDSDDPAYAPTK